MLWKHQNNPDCAKNVRVFKMLMGVGRYQEEEEEEKEEAAVLVADGEVITYDEKTFAVV